MKKPKKYTKRPAGYTWTAVVKKIWPGAKPCRPAAFVPFEGGVMISCVETNSVVYIEGKDLDRLLSMIPWDEKLDPLRKLQNTG